MNKTLSLLLIIALTFGCGKLEEMGNNAEAAKDNSGRAADAAGESREEIAYSRLMGRSGATSAARRKAFTTMLDMESFEMKVTEAAKYLKGFEFQLWTGQRYDSSKYLNALKTDAVNEFFRSTTEAFDDTSIVGEEINPIRISSGKKDRDLNVMALSVAMHQVHSVQKHITVENNGTLTESETMLSLLKTALTNIQKVKKGLISFNDLREHEQAVYHYRQEALTVMEARVDMFMVMALSKVSPLKDSSISGLSLAFFKRKFDSRYLELEEGAQVEVNKYMAEAKKTALFLESLGVKVNPEAKVRSVFEKMVLPDARKLDEMRAQGGMNAFAVENHTSFMEDMSHFYNVVDGRLEIKK